MPFAIPSILKIGAIVVVLFVVGAVLWTVRAALIEKGENIIKAQDNAALVKANAEQMKRDAILVEHQNAYINDLQNQGVRIKETIRVVQGPCKDDGLGDARLKLFDEWVRSRRGAGDNGPAGSGPAAKGTVR